MTASIAIQVLPKAESKEQLISIVDAVIDHIRQSGLPYFVGPFETAVEGDDYGQLMELVKDCQLVAVRAGAKEVSANVKVVYAPEGEVLSIAEKTLKHHKT